LQKQKTSLVARWLGRLREVLGLLTGTLSGESQRREPPQEERRYRKHQPEEQLERRVEEGQVAPPAAPVPPPSPPREEEYVAAESLPASMGPASEPQLDEIELAEADDSRYLNVAVLEPGAQGALPPSCPLSAARQYLLRLDIGELAQDSIVVDPEAVPSSLLPRAEGGHWLEVGLASADFEVPDRLSHMFLPTTGSAWTCSCTPGGKHSCIPSKRERYLSIPITAPARGTSGQLRISLYFENNVVQSVLMSADIVEEGEPTRKGAMAAVTDYTLSRRLTDLDRIEPRLASVVVNETADGSHLLVFKGAGGKTFPLTLTEGQLTSAMDDVRELLLEFHVEQVKKSRRNRLEPGNRKRPTELQSDLVRLARIGFRYWNSLFGQAGEQLFEAGRDGSETIQIARVPSSLFVFPWAVIYDLPLGAEQEGHTLCPLIEEWDGKSDLLPDTLTGCPHAKAHESASNVICPFGFWGFRYAIEQPASTNNRPAACQIDLSPPLSIVIARSLALNEGETTRHLEEMARRLPGFGQSLASSRAEVGQQLANPELEVVYFYCHGKAVEKAVTMLEVGRSDLIPPEQIVAWQLSEWRKNEDHWARTKPLVFLNGCHTTDLTPQSPVNFVDSFSQVGASGVIGTEITMDQKMASEAAEVLFGYLGNGTGLGVGEALRRTRLHFLAKGNVLALAYTAYCRADLHFA
jgi:hypothetical protein